MPATTRKKLHASQTRKKPARPAQEHKPLLSPFSLRNYLVQDHPDGKFRTDGLELLNTILERVVFNIAKRALELANAEQVTSVLLRHIEQAANDTVVQDISTSRIIELILKLEPADLDNIAKELRHQSDILEANKLAALLSERQKTMTASAKRPRPRKIATDRKEFPRTKRALAQLNELRKLRAPGEETRA